MLPLCTHSCRRHIPREIMFSEKKKKFDLHRKRSEPITFPLLCVYVKEAITRELFSGAAIPNLNLVFLNTLRTGDADLRFYITTVQDG